MTIGLRTFHIIIMNNACRESIEGFWERRSQDGSTRVYPRLRCIDRDPRDAIFARTTTLPGGSDREGHEAELQDNDSMSRNTVRRMGHR